MKNYFLICLTIICYGYSNAQDPANVDFDAYLNLSKEVQGYRKNHLVDFQKFKDYSQQSRVIILDARSKEMFDRKHIKGAININFSDFNQATLAAYIPADNKKILIYCNNNIKGDEINFISKMYIPPTAEAIKNNERKILLALNTPTYITLYGYGYRNIYELSEMISVNDPRVEFEGTDVVPRLKLEVASKAINQTQTLLNNLSATDEPAKMYQTLNTVLKSR